MGHENTGEDAKAPAPAIVIECWIATISIMLDINYITGKLVTL